MGQPRNEPTKNGNKQRQPIETRMEYRACAVCENGVRLHLLLRFLRALEITAVSNRDLERDRERRRYLQEIVHGGSKSAAAAAERLGR